MSLEKRPDRHIPPPTNVIAFTSPWRGAHTVPKDGQNYNETARSSDKACSSTFGCRCSRHSLGSRPSDGTTIRHCSGHYRWLGQGAGALVLFHTGTTRSLTGSVHDQF